MQQVGVGSNVQRGLEFGLLEERLYSLAFSFCAPRSFMYNNATVKVPENVDVISKDLVSFALPTDPCRQQLLFIWGMRCSRADSIPNDLGKQLPSSSSTTMQTTLK